MLRNKIRWRFKEDYSLEQRKQDSNNIRNKYPDRIPVIVEKAPKSNIPDIDKQKFLVPKDISVLQFMWIIRKRIQLSPERALFVFIGKKSMVQNTATMGQMYVQYADEDGFLYIVYSGENTFGMTGS